MDGSVDGPYRSGDLKQLRRAIDSITPRHYNHHGPGVTFFDLSHFYANGKLLNDFVDWSVRSLGDVGRTIKKVGGPEARAWPLAGALARDLSMRYDNEVGVVLIRKPGKLPGECDRENYETEYSKGTLEISLGTIEEGDEVLEIDDLVATGGTEIGTGNLIKRRGGIIVASICPIELAFLGGRQRFERAHPNVAFHTLLQYQQGTFHQDVGCYDMVLKE